MARMHLDQIEPTPASSTHSPVGIIAAAGETIIGLLVLSSGGRAKLGLTGAILFLIVITPLGIWTLPNPVLATGLAWLLTKEHPQEHAAAVPFPRRHRRQESG